MQKLYMVWAVQGPSDNGHKTIVFFTLNRADAEKALLRAQIADAGNLRAGKIDAVRFWIAETWLDAWEDFLPGSNVFR